MLRCVYTKHFMYNLQKIQNSQPVYSLSHVGGCKREDDTERGRGGGGGGEDCSCWEVNEGLMDTLYFGYLVFTLFVGPSTPR